MAQTFQQTLAAKAAAARKAKETATIRFAGIEFEPIVKRTFKFFGKTVTPVFPVITFRKKRKGSLLASAPKTRKATLLGQGQKDTQKLKKGRKQSILTSSSGVTDPLLVSRPEAREATLLGQ